MAQYSKGETFGVTLLGSDGHWRTELVQNYLDDDRVGFLNPLDVIVPEDTTRSAAIKVFRMVDEGDVAVVNYDDSVRDKRLSREVGYAQSTDTPIVVWDRAEDKDLPRWLSEGSTVI